MRILYLNKKDVKRTGILGTVHLPLVWESIQAALILLGSGKAVAPLDLYLRPGKEGYFDRIIAKSSFIDLKDTLGAEVAGLKWIASAPLNVKKGLPRANGIILLNDPYTGEVFSIIDAAFINALRTAAVTLVALKSLRPGIRRFVVFGAGIIGKEHLRQVLTAYHLGLFPRLEEICVFDIQAKQAIRLWEEYKIKAKKNNIALKIIDSLNECFKNDYVVVIATNALNPYIERDVIEGKQGLMVVHISLRDFSPEALAAFDVCVVDSWEHVVRENTSVELAYKNGLIKRSNCLELVKLLLEKKEGFVESNNIIINPMGIAVSDITIGLMTYKLAKENKIGINLK